MTPRLSFNSDKAKDVALWGDKMSETLEPTLTAHGLVGSLLRLTLLNLSYDVKTEDSAIFFFFFPKNGNEEPDPTFN